MHIDTPLGIKTVSLSHLRVSGSFEIGSVILIWDILYNSMTLGHSGVLWTPPVTQNSEPLSLVRLRTKNLVCWFPVLALLISVPCQATHVTCWDPDFLIYSKSKLPSFLLESWVMTWSTQSDCRSLHQTEKNLLSLPHISLLKAPFIFHRSLFQY